MKHVSLLTMACPLALGLALQGMAMAQEMEEELDEVTVTGSRIARDGYEAPTPLTVISAEELFGETANASVRETLITLPTFSGGYNITSGAGVPGFNQAGVSSISMRNLGDTRTLVLLDGQRSVGALATGSVDTDNFPQQLVERVEVVTGGASAVYGSDAVAGVVNFILDRDFTGVKGEISGGLTDYGDNENWKLSLATGFGFAGGRGHVLLSGEFTDNKGVFRGVGNRDWGYTTQGYVLNPAYTASNGQPRYNLVNNAHLATATWGGLIVNGPMRGIAFGEGGAPYTFNFGQTTPSANEYFMAGGDKTSTVEAYSLSPRQERKNLFTRVSFDITGQFNVFAQFQRGLNWVEGIAFPHYVVGSASTTATATSRSAAVIYSGNPYIPATVQSYMTSLGVDRFQLGSLYGDLPPPTTETSRRTSRYVLGMEGNFGLFGDRRWNWNAYYQLGETHSDHLAKNVRRDGTSAAIARGTASPSPGVEYRWSWALDAVAGPNGTVICRITLTHPEYGCSPFNPMGTGVNNQAAIDYLLGTAYSYQTVEQEVYAASVSGDVFDNWAGPVSVALSAEHRKEAATVTPDAVAAVTGWSYGNHTALDAAADVSEAAIETVFPLLAGKPFAEQWDLSAAFRYTDYEVSGEVETWKVGSTWTPLSGLRFRGTLSRDIRAPNLNELFQTTVQGLIAVNDNTPTGTGQSVVVNRIVRGTASLKPEKADNFTAGMVVQPSFLPGFNVSLDYWRTRVKGALNSLTAQQVVDFCGRGWQDLCDFNIVRDPSSGAMTTVYLGSFNLDTQTVAGLDLETSYRFPLSIAPGNVSLRLLGTRTLKNETFAGAAETLTDNLGTTGTPKIRLTATAGYDLANFSAGLTMRHFSDVVGNTLYVECQTDCPTSVSTALTFDEYGYSGATYFDLSLSYRLGSVFGKSGENRLFFNVRNLTNKDPELIPGIGTTGLSYIYSRASDSGRWDTLGRTYRAGLQFSF